MGEVADDEANDDENTKSTFRDWRGCPNPIRASLRTERRRQGCWAERSFAAILAVVSCMGLPVQLPVVLQTRQNLARSPSSHFSLLSLVCKSAPLPCLKKRPQTIDFTSVIYRSRMALLPIISANPPPTLGPFAQEIYKHSPDCLQITILVLSGTVARSNVEEYGHMAHQTHPLFLSYLLSHTGELYRLWHAGPALHACTLSQGHMDVD